MIPSIFFCVDIAHSLDISAVLRGHGVRVYTVSGNTPKDERKRLVDMARAGEIDGLASCDALTTGFDWPRCMMAVHARPTASGLWYRQATGRVLRPYPAPQGERPYQRAALVAIWNALRKGVLNQLITMPTGTGKTHVLAQLPGTVLRHWHPSIEERRRVLFLVHREELAEQTVKTFARYNPELRIGVEKADSYASPDADLVVGSIQTIGPAKGGGENSRLASLDPSRFACIITDEAHFGTASQMYENVYRHFGVSKRGTRDPNVLHVGVTATPNRHDNLGLERHYDQIVYHYPLADAIRDRWLCRIRGYRAETTVDISKVRMRGEDFALQDLERTVNTPERNELIAQKYLEICRAHSMDVQDWTPPPDWVKPCAIVLDCADVSGAHSLISLPSLFGLAARYDPKGADVMADAERVENTRRQHPNLDLRDVPDMEALDATLRDVDLLAPPVVPAEVSQCSKFAWLSDGPGAYRLGCMDRRVLTVRQNTLGQWEIHEHVKGLARHLDNARDLRAALRLAEKSLPAQDQRVLPAGAKWRWECPTEIQTRTAWSLDVRLRREYSTASDYYRFCRQRFFADDPRYTKGRMEQFINSLGR